MANQRRVHDIGVIVGGLEDNISALCRELFPAGVKEGNEYRVGSLAGEKGRSMAIHVGAGRPGVWCDYGGRTDDRGDALDLVAKALFRGNKAEAITWAKGWLGLDASDPAGLKTQRRRAEQKSRAQKEGSGRNKKKAFAIWLAAQEKLKGTPADWYLKGRGIDLSRLGYQPRALRFHPGLDNWEGLDPKRDQPRRLPALVAAITNAKGETVAVHRTWLQPSTQPGVFWQKADLKDPKMTLGRYVGGAIRLWRGEAMDPSTGEVKRAPALKDAPPRSSVVIAEGIEDGLTIALAAPEYRVLVAVSLANMGSLDLPAAIAQVIIAADNDAPGSRAAEQLDRAVAHFQSQGRTVRLARAPQGHKDFNDLVKHG